MHRFRKLLFNHGGELVSSFNRTCLRRISSNESIPPFPAKEKLGVTKLLLLSVASIYAGGMMAIYGAAAVDCGIVALEYNKEWSKDLWDEY